MNEFKNFILSYTALSSNDWQIIQSKFTRKEFSEKELILLEGSICKNFYFLQKGLVRFFSNIEGEEVTKFFTKAPYCFTSKESFRNRKPATESIQAIDNVEAWQISYENANELLELKSWSEFTRKFMHEVQCHVEELLMESKTQTAEERYKKLTEKYPDEIHKIPLMYLASFLGVTPQSLSRIRKKI